MIIILLFLATVWLVFLYRRWNNLPPGPVGFPIVGYLPRLDPLAPHISLTKLAKTYGPIYGLYLGSVYTVVLSDAKLIKKALVSDAMTGRAPLYLTHGIMGGYGIICAEGDLWKDQRKFVASSLKDFGVLKYGPKRNKMETLIMRNAMDFIDNMFIIMASSTSVTLDPLEDLRHCVGSTMCLIVFGKVWSRNDKVWKWLQYLQEEGTKHIGVAGPLNFLPFLRFVPKFNKTMQFLLDGKHKTHEIYKKIIEENMKTRNEFDGSTAGIHRDCIIQTFLNEREKRREDSGKYYCDQQFYHLLADIFGAGLDTTLTTLRWYLLYLAIYPGVQRKVQEELDQVLKGNLPTVEDIKSLPFTQASIAEAQRIRSVVPVGIPHGALQETHISNYKIPKGSMIIPLQWALHMDPRLWNEPETFDPSRFINSEGRFFKPEAFIPFQNGKRMCVGDELARMLLFLFGATIVYKFKISVPIGENIDLTGDCGITLTPKPHNLTFDIRTLM